MYRIESMTVYKIIDTENSDLVVATFYDREEAEKYVGAKYLDSPAQPESSSKEDQVLALFRDLGYKVGAAKYSKEAGGKYWTLTKQQQKAQLWNCGARGWSICHPTQHDTSKLSEKWLDIFGDSTNEPLNVEELCDMNGICLDETEE